MALQYVGGNTGTWAGSTSGTNTISLTALTGGLSSSAAAGDLVIAVYATGSAADRTLSITDGSTAYTLVGSELYANGTTTDTNLRVAYKLLSAADSSVTFGATGNAQDAGAAAVHVWRGVDTTNPLDVAAVTATGTGTGRPNGASITPVTSGAVIIVAGGSASATGAAFTASALSNFRTATSADTNDAMVGVGSSDWTAGAYDPAQWTGGTTGTGDSWAAVTLALEPLTLTAVGQDLSDGYDVLEAAGQDSVGSYSVVGAVGADQVGTYGVMQTVGADDADSYAVAQAVGPDLVGTYSMAGAVGADLVQTYGMAGAVGSDRAGSYAVLDAVGTNQAGSYAVTQAAGADFSGSYGIAEAVGQSLVGTYGLAGSVGVDLVGAYGMAGAVGSDLAASYSVLQLAGSDLTGSYAVLEAGFTVGADLVGAWTIYAPAPPTDYYRRAAAAVMSGRVRGDGDAVMVRIARRRIR